MFCLHTQSKAQRAWKRADERECWVGRKAWDPSSLTPMSADTLHRRSLRDGSAVTFAEWLPVERKKIIFHFILFFSTEILNNNNTTTTTTAYVLTLKEAGRKLISVHDQNLWDAAVLQVPSMQGHGPCVFSLSWPMRGSLECVCGFFFLSAASS